ncbi:hypothetical protein CFC21_067944 [Triticum aestivum]|nr:hypothetical protein TRIUR3_10065 [Triticum urartu]KAF7061234.1 hypothetical protein CFC21_067944 [Triticum aestivum]
MDRLKSAQGSSVRFTTAKLQVTTASAAAAGAPAHPRRGLRCRGCHERRLRLATVDAADVVRARLLVAAEPPAIAGRQGLYGHEARRVVTVGGGLNDGRDPAPTRTDGGSSSSELAPC